MDGTLIDSSTLVPTAYAAAVIELGGRAPAAGDVIDAYPLGPPAVLLAHFLGRPAGPDDLDTYYRHLAACASRGVRPYPGVRALLAMAARRMPVAVFTGASRIAATILLERSGLSPWLDELVGGDEVARPKPAPDGIIEACRRLEVAAGEAAYVGDAAIDMVAAAAGGAFAIAAGWGHQHDPSGPSDLVVRSPRELRDMVAAAFPRRADRAVGPGGSRVGPGASRVRPSRRRAPRC